jgi:hypothetical protein
VTGRLDRLGLAVAGALPLRAALHVGGVEGTVAQRLGRRGPSASAVASAFSLGPTQARRVAGAQSANATRSRNLRARLPAGPDSLRPLIAIEGREHLERRAGEAALVAIAPWGPLPVALIPIADLRDDALFLIDWPASGVRAAWGVTLRSAGGDARLAAVALKTAIDHLRAGGLVGLTLAPGRAQATVAVPFFGGTLTAPRGIASMARRAEAPVIPLTAGWRSGAPCVTFHAPLELDPTIADPAAAEVDLLRRLSATFEATARAAPSQGDRRLMAAIRQARAAAASSSPAS